MLVIPGGAQADGDPSRVRDGCRDHRPVRFRDPGTDTHVVIPLRCPQFVTRSQNRHRGAADNGNGRETESAERRDRARRHDMPRYEHHVSELHVRSGGPDVASFVPVAKDAHGTGVGFGIGVFDTDDGVHAGGDGRTGHDPDRLPGPDRRAGHFARAHLARHGQHHRSGRTRTGDVFTEHRVAVHGAVVPWRQGRSCLEILG